MFPTDESAERNQKSNMLELWEKILSLPWTRLGLLVTAVELLGFLTAIRAVMRARTAQGGIAWATALITLPLISVPLYCVFGRNRFHGYLKARRGGDDRLREIADRLREQVQPFTVSLGEEAQEARVLEQLALAPFLRGNSTRLLIDGHDTFHAILAAIERAEHYVLVQFYIFRDDSLGRDVQQALIACVRRGIKVCLQYDEVGSATTPNSYFDAMRNAGVEVSGFKTTRGPTNRFQLNFRNHRKIVIVDGRVGFIGGHNVGDEYVGGDPELTPWRDTHVELAGPAVQASQLSFVEDWYWATRSIPELEWKPQAAEAADQTVFILPSSPADRFETCGLFFTHLINSARRRIWIASPYLVPDVSIISALQLAAMRGVEVRILMAGKADHALTAMAALAYVKEIVDSGVQLYRHQPGFMHQKVALIDDSVTTVGTANFDNRSFRLNFEIAVLTLDERFNREAEAMLMRDFEKAIPMSGREYHESNFRIRLMSRIARLLSPIL